MLKKFETSRVPKYVKMTNALYILDSKWYPLNLGGYEAIIVIRKRNKMQFSI